ncbi:MAG: SRPBCC family protein, partial [Gaiellaceae bacterium]
MAVRQDKAVEREVRIAARPETVFEFLTDPEKQLLWMGRRAELDARPGGIYLVEINDEVTARGEFIEVEPSSRVMFTFGWEGQEAGQGEHGVPPGSSRVEITLQPDGEGTLVRLR